MNDWNPDLYLKYKNERTQPSVDLANRINILNPKSIIDVGCGPGNSTQILAAKWPGSNITGLDNSPAMIEKAGKDYPLQNWILGDAADIGTNIKYDIVFSNALIQWIPDHNSLLRKLYALVDANGALAVQVPDFKTRPINKAIEKAAALPKWKPFMEESGSVFTCHNVDYYYDVLSSFAAKFDIWKTVYMHELDSHKALIEWFRSTAMKPYLEKLESAKDKNLFEEKVLEICRDDYPMHPNGKVLLPFSRIFFVAYK